MAENSTIGKHEEKFECKAILIMFQSKSSYLSQSLGYQVPLQPLRKQDTTNHDIIHIENSNEPNIIIKKKKKNLTDFLWANWMWTSRTQKHKLEKRFTVC